MCVIVCERTRPCDVHRRADGTVGRGAVEEKMWVGVSDGDRRGSADVAQDCRSDRSTPIIEQGAAAS